jgi:uncharacterized protein YodC (DUF2158 family)
MTEFKPGDKIVHKSRMDRKMVVMETDPEGLLLCEWMDAEGEMQREKFIPEVLEKISDSPTVEPKDDRPSVVERAERFFGSHGKRRDH